MKTLSHPSQICGMWVVNVVDQIYKIGRKVTDDFQKNLKIVFDEYLPKWNYRAVPQLTKQSSY
ncbi:hypothetical protein QUA56_02970 [Microcoleus sp. N3A4]|uniref:hypothetical protein n=1 Tax=Microcoleus sp. N3A4 TaxID=3055379 RepID=UPI002FD4ADD6